MSQYIYLKPLLYYYNIPYCIVKIYCKNQKEIIEEFKKLFGFERDAVDETINHYLRLTDNLDCGIGPHNPLYSTKIVKDGVIFKFNQLAIYYPPCEAFANGCCDVFGYCNALLSTLDELKAFFPKIEYFCHIAYYVNGYKNDLIEFECFSNKNFHLDEDLKQYFGDCINKMLINAQQNEEFFNDYICNDPNNWLGKLNIRVNFEVPETDFIGGLSTLLLCSKYINKGLLKRFLTKFLSYSDSAMAPCVQDLVKQLKQVCGIKTNLIPNDPSNR